MIAPRNRRGDKLQSPSNCETQRSKARDIVRRDRHVAPYRLRRIRHPSALDLVIATLAAKRKGDTKEC